MMHHIPFLKTHRTGRADLRVGRDIPRAEIQAGGKSKVFYYYFDQHPDRPADSPAADHGMPHGVDVPLTGRTSRSAVIPTVRGVPAWPHYADRDRRVMVFKNTASPGAGPSADALAVLDSYFTWRSTPEGKAWAK